MLISNVIRRTTDLMQHNALAVLGPVCLLEALQALIASDPYALLAYQGFYGGSLTLATLLSLLAILIGLITQAVVQACVTAAMLAEGEGRKASLPECLRLALRRFLPLILVSTLTSLAIGLGVLMLVVPGLLVATMWFLAAPVTAFEDASLSESFNRSQDLTRGSRWKIFALLLIILGVMIVLAAVEAFLESAVGLISPSLGVIASPMLTVVLACFTTSIPAIVASATYVELRDLHGGGPTAVLGRVFQ
jgi:hypothetical protein